MLALPAVLILCYQRNPIEIRSRSHLFSHSNQKAPKYNKEFTAIIDETIQNRPLTPLYLLIEPFVDGRENVEGRARDAALRGHQRTVTQPPLRDQAPLLPLPLLAPLPCPAIAVLSLRSKAKPITIQETAILRFRLIPSRF